MRINFELFNQYHYCDHVKSQPGLRFYQKNQPGLWGEIPGWKPESAQFPPRAKAAKINPAIRLYASILAGAVSNIRRATIFSFCIFFYAI